MPTALFSLLGVGARAELMMGKANGVVRPSKDRCNYVVSVSQEVFAVCVDVCQK